MSERRKIGVVTGVTSGIGEALVERLMKAGVSVAGIAREADKLEEAARRWGSGFMPVCVDLGVPAVAERCARELAQKFERIDFLVCNAAHMVHERPLQLSTSDWRSLFESNSLANIELIRTLAPRMRRGAHVIAVSSSTARFPPGTRFGAYAATKAALESLMAAVRLELSQRGIRVTVIVPGLVDTPVYANTPGLDRVRATLEGGTMYWGMGDGKMGMIDARDIADASKAVLANPRAHSGKIYELTGPASISFWETATILSEVLGRQIRYVPVLSSTVVSSLKKQGDPWYAEAMGEYSDAFGRNWGNFTTSNVKDLTGHEARSFETFAREEIVPLLEGDGPSRR
jgi:NAD(P)-dependent dehydrogenase (short-subunit alcohol dehydrogenase family)